MKTNSKIFIFTSTINGCQSLSGLHTTLVNVKKLVNPDRGLSTHNRPEKSKCVEVNRQGSLVLKCLHLSNKNTAIGGGVVTYTLNGLNFLPSVNWFRSILIRSSMGSREKVFTEAFSFFSLYFLVFSFSLFSFEAWFLILNSSI